MLSCTWSPYMLYCQHSRALLLLHCLITGGPQWKNTLGSLTKEAQQMVYSLNEDPERWALRQTSPTLDRNSLKNSFLARGWPHNLSSLQYSKSLHAVLPSFRNASLRHTETPWCICLYSAYCFNPFYIGNKCISDCTFWRYRGTLASIS